MPHGSHKPQIRSIPWTIAVIVLIGLVLGACSSTGSGADSGLDPTTAAVPAAGETPPDVAESAPGEVTAEGAAEGDSGPDIVEAAMLDETAFASVTTLDAGEPVEDVAGGLVTAYGVHRLPDEVIQQLRDHDLFGNTDDAFNLAFAPAIIDIGMCAAGADNGASAIEFSLFSDTFDEYVEQPAVFLNHPIAYPGFALPDAGECSRGWLLVQRKTSTPTTVRYMLSQADAGGEIQRHLYQWSVPFSPVVGESSATGETSDDRFGIGQVITFNDGPLVGTTVTFKGWAEIVGAVTALPDTRMVGVLAEVCTATEDWPELGLGIDGWNLLGPLDPGDRLGADPLAPLTGSCFEDWVEFGVPFGATPSSFFVGDGSDPIHGYAEWSLENAAIAPPI